MREWKRDEFVASLRNNLEEARAASALLRIQLHNHDEGFFIGEGTFGPDHAESCLKWVLDQLHSVTCMVRVEKTFLSQGRNKPESPDPTRSRDAHEGSAGACTQNVARNEETAS
jgi:hypothetical protein